MTTRPKLFVANRSEIACRIFQTAREVGFSTVGCLAPGDEDARHITYADHVESVASYLNIDAVVAAAVRSGASFVHPGYGFLSERPAFVRAVEKAGLTFIGPRAETMEALGDKIGAKERAALERVPTLPWAKVPAGGDLKSAAKSVGFPLLLKASAGGGGKGMRRVDRPEDLDAAAESASHEAMAAFGDGTLFLERLLERPRHIEVQVFGDGLGGGFHLRERDCSLQRRHQKVWEEATAPNLSDETRNGLFEASMRLVSGVKYRNAGTLEFLVDSNGGFYFLEMNARLQVEHPVTECVTGVDLVALQLELAQRDRMSDTGKLSVTQTPSVRGHAIEVRLYAEDPAMGYAPTPGTVESLHWPMGPGIRVDSGIEVGQRVGTSFDAMLAKLIVWAPTRAHAVSRMRGALSDTFVAGLGTNHAFLRTLCDDPEVIAGRLHTGHLPERYGDFKPDVSSEELQLLSHWREQRVLQDSGFSRGAGSSKSYPSPWDRRGGGRV